MIGIVGGMGPLAGLDLSRKIMEQTVAGKDQDHVPQVLFSSSQSIGDRTEYIQKKIETNPAHAISEIILKLESIGATIAGLPCNSAHSPEIFEVIKQNLNHQNSSIRLLHMIDEVGRCIKLEFPKVTRVGVLGTSGTYKSRQYNLIEKFGFEVLNVSEPEVEKVHQSIYHPVYGIKSSHSQISQESLAILNSALESLISKGAEVVVLGCTELPLALTKKHFKNIPLIDSNLVLARALIAAIAPDKLKIW